MNKRNNPETIQARAEACTLLDEKFPTAAQTQRSAALLSDSNPSIRAAALTEVAQRPALFCRLVPDLEGRQAELLNPIFEKYSPATQAKTLVTIAGDQEQRSRAFTAAIVEKHTGKVALWDEVAALADVESGPTLNVVVRLLQGALAKSTPKELAELLAAREGIQRSQLLLSHAPIDQVGFTVKVLEQLLRTDALHPANSLLLSKLEATPAGRQEIQKMALAQAAERESLGREVAKLQAENRCLQERCADYERANQAFSEDVESGRVHFKSEAELAEEHRQMLRDMTS